MWLQLVAQFLFSSLKLRKETLKEASEGQCSSIGTSRLISEQAEPILSRPSRMKKKIYCFNFVLNVSLALDTSKMAKTQKQSRNGSCSIMKTKTCQWVGIVSGREFKM